MSQPSAPPPVYHRKVAFIHPDLGIGGAERLVVDAAVGLQNKGYEVTIYTSHCDKSHCFEEVKDGTLKVEVFGDKLPTSIMGKCSILCSNLRQLYLTMCLVATKRIGKFDVFIVDQLSSCVPLLGLNARDAKILFYCHFPDQLLATRDSFLKKVYRLPFDWLEQYTMSLSDQIVVNSNFTKGIFARTFPTLNFIPKVIYPCVNFDNEKPSALDKNLKNLILSKDDKYYLSINRFERKKNIELAIFAFSECKQKETYKLIITGGYDPKVSENMLYLNELEGLCQDLTLTYKRVSYPHFSTTEHTYNAKDFEDAQIIFITSISSSFKELLLKNAELLMYTPSNEHFGIVPLEAMKFGVPVLAVDNGGPVETVVDYNESPQHINATGWLRYSDSIAWAKVLDESVEALAKHRSIFQESGPKRVRYYFSREAMAENFDNIIDRTIWEKKDSSGFTTFTPGILMLITQYLVVTLFGDTTVPYFFLALISFYILRSIKGSFYWIIVFLYMTYTGKT